MRILFFLTVVTLSLALAVDISPSPRHITTDTPPQTLPAYDAIIVNILIHHTLMCDSAKNVYSSVYIVDPSGDTLKKVMDMPCVEELMVDHP